MCLFTNYMYSIYSACIMVLPFNCFVPHSFLTTVHRWRFAVSVYWPQCKKQIFSEKLFIVIIKVMSLTLLKLKHYGFHVRIYRACTSRMILLWWLNGLQRCFSCCSMLLPLCNRQNIQVAAYKTYWLMDFLIIYHWGARSLAILCFEAACTII